MTTSCSAALPMWFVKSLQAFPNSKGPMLMRPLRRISPLPSPTQISKQSEYRSDFLTCTIIMRVTYNICANLFSVMLKMWWFFLSSWWINPPHNHSMTPLQLMCPKPKKKNSEEDPCDSFTSFCQPPRMHPRSTHCKCRNSRGKLVHLPRANRHSSLQFSKENQNQNSRVEEVQQHTVHPL